MYTVIKELPLFQMVPNARENISRQFIEGISNSIVCRFYLHELIIILAWNYSVIVDIVSVFQQLIVICPQ